MSSKLYSCAVIGLDCQLVEVECDVINGLSSFHVVGLGDAAIQESKQRVFPAIRNSGFDFPRRKKIINLAPADLKKQGPHFDLPIALGLLEASKQVQITERSESLFVGELALDGSLRHINGVLSITAFARDSGFKKIFLPACNAKEASLIEGIEIYGIADLASLAAYLLGDLDLELQEKADFDLVKEDDMDLLDMADIQGHAQAKRALMIAAAGAHNLLLTGPPGSGKTLLAKTLPSLLPPLSMEEALEVTKLYSVAGQLSRQQVLKTSRPFRTVHHSASGASIVGGGRIPKPGEISLAHRGVLFLDEIPEFSAKVLEMLRQPLEDRQISIGRAHSTLVYPADFMLIATRNPCPCGYQSDPMRECSCSHIQISKYQKKLSGPLLDRIDLIIEVPRIDFKKLSSNQKSESSAQILQCVKMARDIQARRFFDLPIFANSEMDSKQVKEFCLLDDEGMNIMRNAVVKLKLSGRAYFRLLKVARTIADLESSFQIQPHHVAEALQYRNRDER